MRQARTNRSPASCQPVRHASGRTPGRARKPNMRRTVKASCRLPWIRATPAARASRKPPTRLAPMRLTLMRRTRAHISSKPNARTPRSSLRPRRVPAPRPSSVPLASRRRPCLPSRPPPERFCPPALIPPNRTRMPRIRRSRSHRNVAAANPARPPQRLHQRHRQVQRIPSPKPSRRSRRIQLVRWTLRRPPRQRRHPLPAPVVPERPPSRRKPTAD